ncbi:MAG: hypothetical protein MJE66_03935 [Proteobacteria bacterium]|nr:hypothetical protein [Pseudomonadota bacterium]
MPTLERSTTLTVDFRELLERDSFEIRIDGRAVGIESDERILLQGRPARQISVSVPARPCRVDILLPERGVREQIALDPVAIPHLGAQLVSERRLRFLPQPTAVGFT